MDMYREEILDHYKHPRNFGHLPKPDATVEEGNVTCGDRVIMEINVNKKKEISHIRFSGEGCAISQAAASMLTEKVGAMKLADVMNLTGDSMVEMLGTTLTPSRVRCATLSLEVLHKAVQKISLK